MSVSRKRLPDGRFATEHGMKQNPLYRTWCAMKERCSNPHNKRFEHYGGRGITVCDEWAGSFLDFYFWAITNGYKAGLTIDRIDNSKGYNPDNCRWATAAQQNRNYSRNHNLKYQGETHCIADWAEITGINRATILYRLHAGKPMEEVMMKEDGRSTRWKTISANCTK